MQTQPQESADAKRSLGLEADVTGKLVEIAEPLFVLTIFFNIKYQTLCRIRSQHSGRCWRGVARTCAKFPASAAIFSGDSYG